MESLNKHKEYLDFFEIGVVRDQRKKIENVAKYVGLALRESTEKEMDEKHEDLKQQKKKNLNLEDCSELVQNLAKSQYLARDMFEAKTKKK